MPWTTDKNSSIIHNPQHKDLITLNLNVEYSYSIVDNQINITNLYGVDLIPFDSKNINIFVLDKTTGICTLNILNAELIPFNSQNTNIFTPHKVTSICTLNIPMIKFADQLNNFIFSSKDKSIVHSTLPFDFHPGAFRGSNISSIVIPKSCKKIHPYAFYNTKLIEVTIAKDCEYDETSFPKDCVIKFYE